MVTEMFRTDGMLMQRGEKNFIIDRLPMAKMPIGLTFHRWQVMDYKQENVTCFRTYAEACYELSRREGMLRHAS